MAGRAASSKAKKTKANQTKSAKTKASGTSESEAVVQIGAGAVVCGLPEQPPRQLPDDIHPGRAAAIVDGDMKWVSGTTLRYYFFDKDEFEWDRRRFRWGGGAAQERVVKEAFAIWSDVGMGIDFQEVNDASEAEVRIGFVHGEGSWSWLGRRILQEPTTARTMNFGWDLTRSLDTAIHEIGHTLAMPHEHQNPFAGIVWNEEAVYEALAKPPNSWSRDKTYYNILRKLPDTSVSGSKWDPNSIMHYPFAPGLIKSPTRYFENGLTPAPGLSPADKRWIKKWYPRFNGPRLPKLEPFESRRVTLEAGEQIHFRVEPDAGRRYHFRTFGASDTVTVLFEEVDGEWRFLAGDDDSGMDYNAQFDVRLHSGRNYRLHVRLYWAGDTGDFGVIMY